MKYMLKYTFSLLLVLVSFVGTAQEAKIKDSIVFHAGTVLNDGKLLSSGGRVLSITSLDESLQGAISKCYATAKAIQFDYAYYRKDIGQDLMKLEKVI